jgi:hypothetical protein
MTPEEIKARIRDMVDSLIKDDGEQASSAFHDALTAKSRDRINPPEADVTAVDDETPNDEELTDD